MMNPLLFVYGTLLNNDNRFGKILKAGSILTGRGYFPGVLYDLGEYPGAVVCEHDTRGEEAKVWGEIYSLRNPAMLLGLIDEYEGFGSPSCETNEFIRMEIAVFTGGCPLYCWVYLYNRPVEGCTRIWSGDHRLWLLEQHGN